MVTRCRYRMQMEVILNMNDIALKLHHALAASGKNVFVSPVSLSAALAMLQRGTIGKAAEELREITGNDGSEMGQLLCSPPRDCTIANALFAQKRFPIKQEYIDDLAKNFSAQVNLADFQMENERAVLEINEWAREKTNGAIQSLLESIDNDTILILLNAVYFKGAWKHKFDKEKTIQKNFYCHGCEDSPKLVSMMHIKEDFALVEEENFQALKLAYVGDEVTMIIFLPRSLNGLQMIENQMTPTFIQDLDKAWRKRKVQVSLPKFRVEFSADFKAHLQNIGIQRIFEWNSDLSGITDCEEIRVSEVHQKAVLIVDEEGCEAAAVTAVRIQKRSLPIVRDFLVDRPFFFVICDAKNNLVLFMGRVVEL